MVKFCCSAAIALPADVYFTERDTDAFRRLQGKVLRLGDLEIVEEWRDAAATHVVRLVTRPSVQKYIPLALKRRFNLADFAFEDYLEYRADLVEGPQYTIEFRSIPPMFQEKVDIRGRLIIEPIDAHTCRQTLEGEAQISVFGIRHIAEPVIVDSLHKSYKQLPSVILQWIVEREEILKSEGREGLLKGRPSMGWLPNDAERQERCVHYRSPMREKLLQRGTHNRAGALSEGSVHSDSDQSAEDAPPCTNEHSELDSSIAFQDAVEHFSLDDTTSWQSALSDLGSPQLRPYLLWVGSVCREYLQSRRSDPPFCRCVESGIGNKDRRSGREVLEMLSSRFWPFGERRDGLPMLVHFDLESRLSLAKMQRLSHLWRMDCFLHEIENRLAPTDHAIRWIRPKRHLMNRAPHEGDATIFSEAQGYAWVKVLQGWLSPWRAAENCLSSLPFRVRFEDRQTAPPDAGWTSLQEIKSCLPPGQSLLPTDGIYAHISGGAGHDPVDSESCATKSMKSPPCPGSDDAEAESIPAVHALPDGLQCYPVSQNTSVATSQSGYTESVVSHLTWATVKRRGSPVASTETSLDWSEERTDATTSTSVRIEIESDANSDGSAPLFDPETETATSSESFKSALPPPADEQRFPREIEEESAAEESRTTVTKDLANSKQEEARTGRLPRPWTSKLEDVPSYLLRHWRWVGSCFCWSCLLTVVVIVLSLGAHDQITGSDYILPGSPTPDSGEAANDTSPTIATQLQPHDVYHDVNTSHSSYPLQPILPPERDAETYVSRLPSEAEAPESRAQMTPAAVEVDVATELAPFRCRRPVQAVRRDVDTWALLADLRIVTEIVGVFGDDGELLRDTCYEFVASSAPRDEDDALPLPEMLNANTSVFRIELRSRETVEGAVRGLKTVEVAKEVAYDGVSSTFAAALETESASLLRLIAVLDSPLGEKLHILDESFEILQRSTATVEADGGETEGGDLWPTSADASPEESRSDEIEQSARTPVALVERWTVAGLAPAQAPATGDLAQTAPADWTELESDDRDIAFSPTYLVEDEDIGELQPLESLRDQELAAPPPAALESVGSYVAEGVFLDGPEIMDDLLDDITEEESYPPVTSPTAHPIADVIYQSAESRSPEVVSIAESPSPPPFAAFAIPQSVPFDAAASPGEATSTPFLDGVPSASVSETLVPAAAPIEDQPLPDADIIRTEALTQTVNPRQFADAMSENPVATQTGIFHVTTAEDIAEGNAGSIRQDFDSDDRSLRDFLWWCIAAASGLSIIVCAAMYLYCRRSKAPNIVPQVAIDSVSAGDDSASDGESVVPEMDLPTGRTDLDQLSDGEVEEQRLYEQARRDLDSASGRRPASGKLSRFRAVYFPFKSLPTFDHPSIKDLRAALNASFERLKSRDSRAFSRRRKCKVICPA